MHACINAFTQTHSYWQIRKNSKKRHFFRLKRNKRRKTLTSTQRNSDTRTERETKEKQKDKHEKKVSLNAVRMSVAVSLSGNENKNHAFYYIWFTVGVNQYIWFSGWATDEIIATSRIAFNRKFILKKTLQNQIST